MMDMPPRWPYPPPTMNDGAASSQFHSARRELPEATNTEYLSIFEVPARRKRASERFPSASKRPRFFDPSALLDKDSSGDDENEDHDPLAEHFYPDTYYRKIQDAFSPMPQTR